MIDEPTSDRVRQLRAQGLTPKEIARNLGIRPAQASSMIRKLALEHDSRENDENVECLLNAGWSTGLQIDGHLEWHDPGADATPGGLVTALVARRHRHRRGSSVCVYLLDVWCLGVKNALGPTTIDEQSLRHRTQQFFRGYPDPPIAAPIELVRDLVLGAAEYARQLGFSPHPDFHQARPHLGPSTGPSAITFGYNGKPTYNSGPYDDPGRVLRTLQHAVGRDGFNYTIGVDPSDLPLTG